MATSREILLIIVLIVLIAVLVKVFLSGSAASAVAPNATAASNFVSDDLHVKYPTADIGIVSVTPEYNSQGTQYYSVEARVTQDPQTPCPQLSHIFYNYPEQNFVPQPTEVITSNCSVCNEGICNIQFPEEAIIASHTFPGTQLIQSYLGENPGAAPAVTENGDDWLVQWSSAATNESYLVDVHSNGSILSVTATS
jgi:hypothetical protein